MNSKGSFRHGHIMFMISIMMFFSVMIIIGIEFYKGLEPEVNVISEVNQENVDNLTETEVSGVIDPDGEQEVLKEAYINLPVVDILPNDMIDVGVSIHSNLTLQHFDQVSVEEIESNFSIEPMVSFHVEKEAEYTFNIILDEAMPRGTLMKTKYTYKQRLFGESFITEPELEIISTYPTDDNWRVPRTAGVEIRFNRSVTEDIIDYFVIDPAIEGKLEVKNDVLYFLPNEKMEFGKEYKVTLNEGYSLDDMVLEPYTFSYRVTDSFLGNENYSLELETMTSVTPENEAYIKVYDYESKLTGIETVAVYQMTENLEENISQRSHDFVMESINENGDGVFLKDMRVEYQKQDWWDSKLILEESLDKGLYYVVIKNGSIEEGTFLQVSNKNAYFVADKKQVLLWIAEKDLVDKSAMIYFEDQLVGKLDESGFGAIDIELEEDQFLVVTVEMEDETFYIPIEVRSDYGYSRDYYYSSLYTDREIYRNTDTVNVSGFIKDRRGNLHESVSVSLEYDGKVIESMEVQLDEIGGYHTSFSYEDYYGYGLEIVVKVGDELIDTNWVNVADFEKPTYKMDTELSDKFIMNGEQITYTNKVSYYDGTAVTNSRIELYLSSRNSNWYSDGNILSSTKNYSSSTGENSIDFTIKSNSTGWRPETNAIRANVQNLQNTYLSSSDFFVLFPKDIMIEGEVKRETQGAATIDVNCHHIEIDDVNNAYNYDEFRGEPVKGKDVDVKITETYYEKVFVDKVYNEIYKRYYDKYKYIKHSNQVYEGLVTTDADGLGQIEFDKVISGRYYKVQLTSTDKAGSSVVENVYFGGTYNEWEYDHNYDRAKYTLDIEKELNTKSLYNQEGYYYYYYDHEVDYDGKVSLELLFNDEQITSDDDQMLVVEQRNGINHYTLTDDTKIDLIFDESRVPSTHFKVVYFDGTYMTSDYDMTAFLSVSKESRQLDMEVTFDKDEYEPGDSVYYTISTTDKDGKPKKTSINVSVVDEAVFAVAEDYSDPLYSLYQPDYYTNIIAEYLMTPINAPEDFDGAEGGEGGPDNFRDDFEDTAYFTNVITDDYGYVSGIFILPDNITSWRVTTTAYSKDAMAVKEDYSLPTGLNFFIDMVVEEKYRIGDDVYIGLKSEGDSAYLGKEVTLNVRCLNLQEEVVVEEEYKEVFGQRVSAKLGQLEEGNYILEVTAECQGEKDGIQVPLEMKENIAVYHMEDVEGLSTDLEIIHNNNIVSLSMFNEAAYDYYNELSQLTWNAYSEQNVLSITGEIAKDKRNSIFEEGEVYSLTYGDVLDDDGYVRLLEASKGDLLSTARLLSIGLGDYLHEQEKEKMLRSASLNIINKNYLDSRVIRSNWVKVLLLDPDFESMDKIAGSWDEIELVENKCVLIQCYLDAGKYTRANQLLDYFIWEYDIDMDNLGKSFSADKKEDEVIAFMMLAAMVKTEEFEKAKEIMDYIDDRDSKSYKLPQFYVSEPEKLLYTLNKERPVLESTVTYELNQEQSTVELGYNNQLDLSLFPEEAESFKVLALEGDTKIIKNYAGFSSNLPEEKRIVTKTYTNIDGSDEIHIGDTVLVHLIFNRSNGERNFHIQDVLPAGLSFYETGKQGFKKYLYGSDKGQMVDLYGYVSSYGVTNKYVESEVVFMYRAIATSEGRFSAEPVMIDDNRSEEQWVGEESWITILEDIEN